MKIRILRRKTENSRHTEITIQEQEPENEISAEIIEIEKKKRMYESARDNLPYHFCLCNPGFLSI